VTGAAGFHGIVPAEGVHFGIALWPYDLLLRFGYDLPENEHTWEGKWFDDVFEAAAFDIRATAAKLMHALRDVDEAAVVLRRLVVEPIPVGELEETSGFARRAPLTVDLAEAYVQRLLDDLARVIPCCYGLAGRELLGQRRNLAEFRRSPALRGLDAALADLLGEVALTPDELPPPLSHTPALYLVSDERFGSALPKAAARFVQESCRATLASAEALAATTNALAPWLDRLLAHLQQAVAARSEPGPELIERWAVRDWSLLARETPGEGALTGFLPTLA
jgi:hypothetical protein